MKTYTDFNGEVTNYDYDEQNRLTLKDLEDDEDVSYTYTDDGQIETITDSRGTTEFKYDELGRLLWRKDPDGEHLASGNTIEYQYDDAGNITQVETKAGTIEYKYDEWNRLKEVKEGNEITSYFYDEVGNLERTEFPNGTVETRGYDELHRLQVLEVKDENDAVLAKYEYELNDAGYREQVKESLLQPDGSIVERTIDYDYDELYRLLEAAILGGETVEYAYDDVGNRISSTNSQGTREYVYDDNDRLMQELVNGQVVVSYTYDDNGNLKTRTEGGETVNYLWDDQNRLVEVQSSSGIVNYAYDDDNIRVSQTVGGETTSYLLDKNRPYAQVLAEFVGDEEIASYVYGLDLISQERNDVDSYYLVDGLGSTRGLTDESGNVTDVYSYDAYGSLTNSVGNSENDYLFAGEQFDEHLDQYYLRQRYYDPNVGRFTRRDTYEGQNFEPITLHKYIYANANPINGIDPSGLFTLTEHNAAVKIADTLNQAQLESGMRFLGTASGDKNASTASGIAGDSAFDLFSAYHPIGKVVSLGMLAGSIVSSIFPEDSDLDRDAKRIAQKYYVNKEGKPDKRALSGRTVAVGRIQGTGQKVVVNSLGRFTKKQEQELKNEGYIVLREKQGSKPHFDAERRLIRSQYNSKGKKTYQLAAIGASRPLCSICWAHMQLEGIRRGSPIQSKVFPWRKRK